MSSGFAIRVSGNTDLPGLTAGIRATAICPAGVQRDYNMTHGPAPPKPCIRLLRLLIPDVHVNAKDVQARHLVQGLQHLLAIALPIEPDDQRDPPCGIPRPGRPRTRRRSAGRTVRACGPGVTSAARPRVRAMAPPLVTAYPISPAPPLVPTVDRRFTMAPDRLRIIVGSTALDVRKYAKAFYSS